MPVLRTGHSVQNKFFKVSNLITGDPFELQRFQKNAKKRLRDFFHKIAFSRFFQLKIKVSEIVKKKGGVAFFYYNRVRRSFSKIAIPLRNNPKKTVPYNIIFNKEKKILQISSHIIFSSLWI